jgi:hypothetical protein
VLVLLFFSLVSRESVSSMVHVSNTCSAGHNFLISLEWNAPAFLVLYSALFRRMAIAENITPTVARIERMVRLERIGRINLVEDLYADRCFYVNWKKAPVMSNFF